MTKLFKRKALLGFNTNAKTVKGTKLGFYTGILYLAPSDISGHQVCPMAKKANCETACLYTAGRGAFNSIQLARITKTKSFFEDKNNFMLNLVKDIEKGIKTIKTVLPEAKTASEKALSLTKEELSLSLIHI